MKENNKLVISFLVLIIVVLIIIIVYLIFNKHNEIEEKTYNVPTISYFIYDDIDISLDDNNSKLEYFIHNEKELNDLKNKYNINEESTYDFENYNYAYLISRINECGEELVLRDYEIKNNEVVLNIIVNYLDGYCANVFNVIEIPVLKQFDNLKVNYQFIEGENNFNNYGMLEKKPVLYLYPKEETKVSVGFKDSSVLTTTYPKYNNGWEVTAKPNGDLYDKDGKYYYALYWESKSNKKVNFSEGYYVEGNEIEFLEEKLSILGLNEKERNEFIMYWLPILESNKKNLIYFETTEELENHEKINIEPQPDTLIRIRMHVKKVNKKVNIKEQELTEVERIGFTAIEWGGINY